MGRGRRTLVVAFKAVVGLALLGLLIVRLDVHAVLDSFASLAWGGLALAFLAQLAAKFVWTVRWQEILRAVGLERRFADLLALVFVGLFFNNFLPTSMGGDLVRGYYASRGRGGIAMNYAVLVVERALGLITLMALAAVAAVTALLLRDPRLPRELLAGVALVALCGTAVGIVGFAWKGWRARLQRLAGPQGRVSRMLAEVSRALDLFHSPATPRLRIVAYSFLLQVVAVLFHVACARAVGLQTPALVFFLVVPASVVAALLPVTLNGLGLREGVLVGLLAAYGAPSAAAGAFAVLALLVALVFALLGGLVYPFYVPPSKEVDRGPLDT